MTDTRHYSTVEIKAGIFMAFCLALFVGMLLIYGKIPRLWRGHQVIHAAFASANGLRPDAAVRYNGVEVGRVRSMRILHLDRDNLKRLTLLTRKDLDQLPLSDAQRKKLRLVTDFEFNDKCREALQDKTMIELVLEVLQEGQWRRYRIDDTVRITSNLFGDNAVEIISGSSLKEVEENILLVGSSGDFFTNLASSMDEVKEVLSSVTDIVGAEERASFRRATGRIDGILDRVANISKISHERSAAAAPKLTGLDESARKGLETLGKLFERMQPDTTRLFNTVAEARDDLSKRLSDLWDQLVSAREEMSGQAKEIAADFHQAMERGSPYVDEMKARFRELGQRAGGLSTRIDRMTYFAGRVIEQSEPDLERTVEGMQNGFENLKSLKYIREHIDKVIGGRDMGEHEFYTALETYRSLMRAARYPREAAEELALWAPLQPSLLPEIEATQQRMDALQRDLEKARDLAAQAMLPVFTGTEGGSADTPPFPRKRAGHAVFPLK